MNKIKDSVALPAFIYSHFHSLLAILLRGIQSGDNDVDPKSRLLIVDDESGPRESLKMVLKQHYSIEEADSGLKALQIIREKKVDLVTLDLRMPTMDGMTVLAEIKKYDPHIEVLIITAVGSVPKAVELVFMGACCYLIKPFKVDRLLDEVARATNRKRKYDQSSSQNQPELSS